MRNLWARSGRGVEAIASERQRDSDTVTQIQVTGVSLIEILDIWSIEDKNHVRQEIRVDRNHSGARHAIPAFRSDLAGPDCRGA